ncbi:MAG: tetratricopeptide repeat protein, partial [Duncaniella sp.]|nr:tetratricopeptide repeat protein [Duncaniella sp.]
LILALLASGVLAAMSKSQSGPTAEDVRKADYIYLEALRAKSQGNGDAAFDLLTRAHELNPSDYEIGEELANYILSVSQGDSTAVAKALELMRDYYDSAPDDYYAGVKYALLNEQLADRDEALRVWGNLHGYYPNRDEITFRYAQVLGQGGDDAERSHAIAIYDSLEQMTGKSIELSTKKIQLYYTRNDTASIIGEVDALRTSAPNDVNFLVFSGDIYSMFKYNDKAKEFYDQACVIDPSSGLAYYSRAQFYNSLGDSAAFDREVFQALKQDNLDVDTKLMILRSYIQEMYNDSVQQPRIRQLFDVLIEQHPHERDLHDMYARYLIIAKDYKEAAAQEQLSLDLDPADEEGWEMLTSLYLQNEDLGKAEEAAVRSLRYYPENARQYLVLGSIYSQNGERDKAVAEYDKALGITDPSDVEMLSNIYGAIGDNFYAGEQPDSAFVYYKKAIAYNPANYLALNNSAYYLACEGRDLDEALRMIETVMAAEPDNPTSMDTYAWVLFKRKDYAKAREVIDRTMELSEEESADILEHAGDIYFMDGEPDEAVEFWKKALVLAPDNELLGRKVKHKTYFFK